MATLDTIEAQLNAIDNKLDTLDAHLDVVEAAFDNLIIHHTCSVCHGSGEVDSPSDGEPGPPYQCPSCGGDGSVDCGYINTSSED